MPQTERGTVSDDSVDYTNLSNSWAVVGILSSLKVINIRRRPKHDTEVER